jgi:diguanylate cyclase (GGDEF)-like protein
MERPSARPSPGVASDTGHTRQWAATLLRLRAGALAEAAALTAGAPETGAASPLSAAIARLLSDTVRDGGCGGRDDAIAGLVSLAGELGVEPQELFPAVHRVAEAAAEIVRNAGDGGAHPAADTLVRAAAFDLVAAWTAHALDAPRSPAVTDTLTTLHTRVVLDTVLAKECQRAERHEHWLSTLLIAVDDLADINRVRGYGVGDQVLERIGILIRRYFRQQDWVARYGEDVVGVVLPETGPEDALTLARMMRTMIEERLTLDDDHTRPVTVSVAVASTRPLNGYPVDADRIYEELDAVLQRVKAEGAGQVELVEIHPVTDAPDGDSPGEE